MNLNATPEERKQQLEAIRAAAERVREVVVGHYRHLHQYPELSWHESKTSAYVVDVLAELGLVPRRIGENGVVVDVDPAGAKEREDGLPRRALRADMDAICAHEATGLPYESTVPGVMHACGHDAHTSILLGAAAVLQELAAFRCRPLRLVFQPAEEVLPSGAAGMIEGGVLENVSDIISLHVWPALPTGQVGLRPGPMTAAADLFEIELTGPGGHGARPYETVDLVALAARIVGVLVDVPRQHFHPFQQPTVISFGSIHGGESANVIPDQLTLRGTARSYDAHARTQLSEIMESVIRNQAEPAGAGFEFRYDRGPPALVNDGGLTRLAEGVVLELFGPHAVSHLDHPSMGSEDFAFFTQKVPGMLLRLGCVAEGETAHPLHSNQFHVDHAALSVGVQVMASLGLL